MIVRLELTLDETKYEQETGKKLSDDEIKDELTQMLFEVCEEWVLRNQQPDLEFI